jgi:hypothetical protein
VEVVIGIKGRKVGLASRCATTTTALPRGMLDLLRDVFNVDSAFELKYKVDPG